MTIEKNGKDQPTAKRKLLALSLKQPLQNPAEFTCVYNCLYFLSVSVQKGNGNVLVAGLLIRYFLLKLYTIGWVSYQGEYNACCVFPSVMAGWRGHTGQEMSSHIGSIQSASKTCSPEYRSGEQSPMPLFCFVRLNHTWLVANNDSFLCMGWLLASKRHWGRRGHSWAFCDISASLLNLAVIRTCRCEGWQAAPSPQGPFSSQKKSDLKSTGVSERLLTVTLGFGSDLQTWQHTVWRSGNRKDNSD